VSDILHATAISINGHGIILCGPSGSGKSDLALRLIDRGACLISDDQVIVDIKDGVPVLCQAPNIAGLIEVRGVGVITLPVVDIIPLRLVLALDAEVERLPGSWAMKRVSGYLIPLLPIAAYTPSAAIKVEIALKSLIADDIMPVAVDAGPLYKK
jgi:HPr kinase/phosphorylase